MRSFKRLSFVTNVALVFFTVASMLFTSCANRKGAYFNSDKEDRLLSMPVNVVQEGEVSINALETRIGPNHLLSIINMQNEDFINGLGTGKLPQPNDFIVDSEGYLNMPIIGKIKAEGLTQEEFEEKLNDAYKTTVLKDPMFNVKIANRVVTLLGEFSKQGNFTLKKERVSLVEIIGEANGLTSKANKRNIKVIRGNPKNPQILILDLTDVQTLADPRVSLIDGDIVYAQPKKVYNFIDNASPFLTFSSVALTLVNFLFLIAR